MANKLIFIFLVRGAKMQKEKIKFIIKEWILRLNETETLPENIIAINFGLYEPYGIELIGSACYDADDDWACEEDFEPAERQCPNLNIDENEDWEDVLNLIQSVLQELVTELEDASILNVEHITTGFSDGDLCIVK